MPEENNTVNEESPEKSTQKGIGSTGNYRVATIVYQNAETGEFAGLENYISNNTFPDSEKENLMVKDVQLTKEMSLNELTAMLEGSLEELKEVDQEIDFEAEAERASNMTNLADKSRG